MENTGIVRPVDKMGRVVIPKEIRKHLGIENDVDSFEIHTDGDCVILKKYRPTCVFCGELSDSIEYCGYNICLSCVEKLKEIKDNFAPEQE